MTFHNLHTHGFVRIACAAPRLKVADPAFNVARDAVACCARPMRSGASLALFPELGLSAYAIDDLLQQNALLDAVLAALAPAGRGDPHAADDRDRRRAPAGRRAAVQLRDRHPSRPHPGGRRRKPTCRTTASSTSAGSSPRASAPASTSITLCGQEVPFGTRYPAEGERYRRFRCSHGDLRGRLDAGAAELLRRAGGRDRAAQPLGLQRHHRQVGLAPRACARPIPAAASRPMPIRRPGRANRPPISPGTARR